MRANPFEGQLERLARTLAEQFGVQVVCQGDSAWTDGRRIVLPSLPEPLTRRAGDGALALDTAGHAMRAFAPGPRPAGVSRIKGAGDLRKAHAEEQLATVLTTRRLLTLCARLQRGNAFPRALEVCVLSKAPAEDRKDIAETFEHHVGPLG
ncbi:MAG: hypothetical protein GXY55_16305 [Phycisphaerae bacterium]|nr:hypothetical protein [Phycisphaerae bacterium]